MRGFLLAVVLLVVSVSGAIAAPGVAAVGPDDAAAELGTPMVDVSDRRDPQRAGTAVVLLAANAMMLGVGGVLLWRRCVATDPEVSP